MEQTIGTKMTLDCQNPAGFKRDSQKLKLDSCAMVLLPAPKWISRHYIILFVLYIPYFHYVYMCVYRWMKEVRGPIRVGCRTQIGLQLHGPAARWTGPLQWSSRCSHWAGACGRSHNECCAWRLSGPADVTCSQHEDVPISFQQSDEQGSADKLLCHLTI